MNSTHACLLAAGLGFALSPALAHADDFYLAGGGWNYKLKGNVTSTTHLDFNDDLHMETTRKGEISLGYIPDKLGWIPGVDFNYVKLAARGNQVMTSTTTTGLIPITTTSSTSVETSLDLNDIDASFRWPYVWNDFSASAGLTIAKLQGNTVYTDPSARIQYNQAIDQTFPLISVGMRYFPSNSLSFTARGDYISQGENKAQTIELGTFWKIIGPLGLEAGWRQRAFKVKSDNGYRIDSKFSGARAALRLEFSR